ncbi:MAG: PrgI family protein [Lachnospiraceae bacterium]|nr:PrgI family protein [Lachnospiraceae bacterium]
MGYVNIPKDLTKIDRKVMLNLTKRQLSLFIPAIILGIGAYLLTYKKIGTNAMYLTVAIIVPFFYAALYKNRDNERIEDIILRYLKFKYFSCNTRVFTSRNIYKWIIRKEGEHATKKAGNSPVKASKKHPGQSKRNVHRKADKKRPGHNTIHQNA